MVNRNGRITVALSAAALAVALLGATSLGSAAEIATRSVLAAPSAVEKSKQRGPRGPRGRVGRPGPPGAKGDTGPQGERGPQGEHGEQGERGAQGERGTQGERGAAGTAVATRIRSTREVATGSGSSVLWPMTGNSWTQRADSTHLLVGQVEVRYPAACDGTGTYSPYGYLNVILDGEYVGSAYAGWYSGAGGRTQTLGVSFYPGALLAPGDDLTRAMTVRVSDTCTGAGQDFTFDAFKVDVISAS
jgi:hypothetical protein